MFSRSSQRWTWCRRDIGAERGTLIGEQIDLELPARPSYLSFARVLLAGIAANAPTLQEKRLADLQLIVSEVFTNAMKANWRVAEERLQSELGASPSEEQVQSAADPVVFMCLVGLHEIELSVTDHGKGFDNEDKPHPPLYDPERLHYEHGLGIPLIQYLSDEVDYTTGPDGTTVRVVVRDIPADDA